MREPDLRRKFLLGDWVLVRFPQEDSGRQRKLSRPPWHGPYRIAEVNNPDVTVVPVYFPEERVHPSSSDESGSISWKVTVPVGFIGMEVTSRSPGASAMVG